MLLRRSEDAEAELTSLPKVRHLLNQVMRTRASSFAMPFMLKLIIILPRQARDKHAHRGSTQKEMTVLYTYLYIMIMLQILVTKALGQQGEDHKDTCLWWPRVRINRWRKPPFALIDGGNRLLH
eukprot:COSAG06_NODE_616_length_13755_cov_32.672452_8_plen_124_part_00